MQTDDMTADDPRTADEIEPRAGTITINWAASQDASPPITYRVYRDRGPRRSAAPRRRASPTRLVPGSSHTYVVDAVDRLKNPPSAKSPPSDPITVSALSGDLLGRLHVLQASRRGPWNDRTWPSMWGSAGLPRRARRLKPVSRPAFAYKLLPTTLEHGVHEHERQRDVTGFRPARSCSGCGRAANGPIARVYLSSTGLSCRSGPTSTAAREELGGGTVDRVARHRAVRHGRSVRVVGPVPRRRSRS